MIQMTVGQMTRRAALSSRPARITGSAKDINETPRRPEEEQRSGTRVSAFSALAPVRLRILRELDGSGPLLVREMRRAWPITRQHLWVAVRSLADDGLVTIGPNGAAPRLVQLTETGSRALEWWERDRSVLDVVSQS